VRSALAARVVVTAVTILVAGGCTSPGRPSSAPEPLFADTSGPIRPHLPQVEDRSSATESRRSRGSNSQVPESQTLAAIGLTRDDTIFTASARTVDFNGQALIPRFTFVRASHLYDGNDRVRDPERTELTVAITSVRTVFGLNENATLAVYVPHVSKELERTVLSDNYTCAWTTRSLVHRIGCLTAGLRRTAPSAGRCLPRHRALIGGHPEIN
jgi:hypothetical protein